MFYRIEILKRFEFKNYNPDPFRKDDGYVHDVPVWSGCAWFLTDELRVPKLNQFQTKDRFYFTEKGFNKFGRDVIKQVVSLGYKYRIVKIKRKMLDINYKDKYQVAGKLKK